MQKRIYLLALIILTSVYAQAQNRWSVGLQLGVMANHAKYSGGMSDASALFNNNEFGTGQLGIYFRYRITDRLSFQTGYDFSEFGFNYALAKDYNLLNPSEHYAELQTGTCISRIPAIVIYNSKLNCRNMRFIVGGGFTLTAIDNNWESSSSTRVTAEGVENLVPTDMTQQTHSTTSASSSFTWLIGIEKVFKRGNMLALTFQANYGFTNIAESTVSYTANNENYTHTFSNKGSWAGVGLCYYFLPMGSRKHYKAR